MPTIITDKNQLEQQFDNVLAFHQINEAAKIELKQYLEVAYHLGMVELAVS